MKISVKVKANAKQSKIEKAGEGSYLLWVRQPAKEGKANCEIVKLISEYFSVPKSSVSIRSGMKCRNKTVEITPP